MKCSAQLSTSVLVNTPTADKRPIIIIYNSDLLLPGATNFESKEVHYL